MITQPVTKIVVDKKEEAKFRRRAMRALPNEYIETLFGFVENDVVHICAFVDIEHNGKPTSLEYEEDDLRLQDVEAQRHGLKVLGTIHTHPNRSDAMYSETDARDCWETTHELVFGICAISFKGKRRRCHVAYWPGVKPLPVDYKTDYVGRSKSAKRR